MKILITGANGLLGQKLITLFSEDKLYTVIATGRGTQRIPEGSYSYFQADLSQKQEVETLMTFSTPDAIIHCAAMTQVNQCEENQESCWAANVSATSYLLEAATRYQAYFQYISTDFVFSGEDGPYQEKDLPNPVNFYGESKLQAEGLVQKSGLYWSIIRTVLVYGVGYDMSRSNIVLWVKKSLEAGRKIKVVNDQVRTPTLVEDLAIGCKKVLDKRSRGIFHISGDETFTPCELAVYVAKFFKLDSSLITAVTADTFKEVGKRPPRTGFIIDRAKRELQFEPRSLEQGLKILGNQLSIYQ